MTTGQIPDRTMSEAEVGQKWAEVVEEVTRERARIIVEQGGVPVAAVISADELDRYKRLDREAQERMTALLERARAPYQGKSDEEIMEEVGKVIEEVRAEMREEARREAEDGSVS
ncbi:MAG TPA: type II toxin-antitoxin system prevent-host-death family antitoxin [Ktedonobacterales bacterium]|nr:type II toxin-antitoxin system prevent-host-death family antitoxin [Ktedonobacterales bacterium]